MTRSIIPRFKKPVEAVADVCLIVEGCYPYVRGGVSSWVDWLVRSQFDLSFQIVSIWPQPLNLEPQYALPANVLSHNHLYLYEPARSAPRIWPAAVDEEAISASLAAFLDKGDLDSLSRLLEFARRLPDPLPKRVLWRVIERMYETRMPQTAFLDFFWAWRSLFGGLFATLQSPLPKARVYHALSTGYAGLLAGKARLETGRPVILTEHGIYTNERRMEILMADWISDSIDKGLSLDDPRPDIRDLWIAAFESYAQACYAASDEIITLYSANQILQRQLGARPERLRVIPNGIDVDRFARLPRAADDDQPTIAFIGRVAPIKDAATFIEAAVLVKNRMPQLRVVILGPTEEDPAYFDECRKLTEELGATDFITFMGSVSVADYLPKIHLVVLTSLSEAQPLALLEAGAAGVACIATDVGACREILEGTPDERPNLGRGGIVTGIAAPEEIATAILSLLTDHERRRQYGEVLRARVASYYQAQDVATEYGDLYSRLGGRAPFAIKKSVA